MNYLLLLAMVMLALPLSTVVVVHQPPAVLELTL